MNQLRLLSPLLAATLLVAPLSAQEREADHDQLRALRERLVTALSGSDIDALAACFAPHFAFTGSDQALATSRGELEAYYAKWFEGEEALLDRIEISAEADDLTEFTGPDTGFNHGTGVITYHLTSGPVVPIPSRWTSTVRKIDDEWLVETVHIGVNVLENPIMEAQVGFWRTASFTAGVAGLLVGALLTRLLGKGRRAA